jgi:hypothetical protein
LAIWESCGNISVQSSVLYPSAGAHIVAHAKRLLGFDGTHLKGDMSKRGVYIVATVKDYVNHIVPFGFALAGVENFDNWKWFLKAIKEEIHLQHFTVLSDRQKGLICSLLLQWLMFFSEQAIAFAWDVLWTTSVELISVSATKTEEPFVASPEVAARVILSSSWESSTNPDQAQPSILGRSIESFGWNTRFMKHTSCPPTMKSHRLSEQANNWMGNELRSSRPLDAFGMYFRKFAELASAKRQKADTWLRTSTGSDLVPRKFRWDWCSDGFTVGEVADYYPVLAQYSTEQ